MDRPQVPPAARQLESRAPHGEAMQKRLSRGSFNVLDGRTRRGTYRFFSIALAVLRRAACLFGMYPFLQKLFADGGYQGPEFQKALAKILPHLETEIVKRPDHAKGFVVLPRRWVVERTIAWNILSSFGQNGRFARPVPFAQCVRAVDSHSLSTAA
jgi:hypothetical protein